MELVLMDGRRLHRAGVLAELADGNRDVALTGHYSQRLLNS